MSQYKGSQEKGLVAEKIQEKRRREHEQFEVEIQRAAAGPKHAGFAPTSNVQHTSGGTASKGGLMTLAQWQAHALTAGSEEDASSGLRNVAKGQHGDGRVKENNTQPSMKSKHKPANKNKTSLSFSFHDHDEQESNTTSPMEGLRASHTLQKARKRAKKDPLVDTSCLPDRDREAELAETKERLTAQWLSEQNRIKCEYIDVVFSYWDGSGHQYSTSVQKGSTIRDFLAKALERLRPIFLRDLKNVYDPDHLLYIKEDVILPQNYTFYDFIINKTRGKTGPLFDFGSKTAIRLHAGAASKDSEPAEASRPQDVHVGKIVTMSWYLSNKHSFPAARWVPFDPEADYGEYNMTK